MFDRGIRIRTLMLICLLAAPAAQAQFAVIDIGAITQLIAQAQTLEAQLTTARNNLAQAQAEYNSITGGRGMEQLLAGVQRNYLPTNWADLQAVMKNSGGTYGVLSNGVLDSFGTNAVMSPQLLATLPADVSQQIDTSRRLTALHQNIAREALATTSNRFASLQQLIQAIPTATDQKAVLELQARIGAETTLMQNEQTKLQILGQLIQAEERANEQQMRERAVVGQGQFESRFRPVP